MTISVNIIKYGEGVTWLQYYNIEMDYRGSSNDENNYYMGVGPPLTFIINDMGKGT